MWVVHVANDLSGFVRVETESIVWFPRLCFAGNFVERRCVCVLLKANITKA